MPLSECPGPMRRMHADRLGDVVKGDLLAELIAQHIFRDLQPAGRCPGLPGDKAPGTGQKLQPDSFHGQRGYRTTTAEFAVQAGTKSQKPASPKFTRSV